MRCAYVIVSALAVAIGCSANADPCEGPLPAKAGTVFTGTVHYIVDGDGICVGPTSNPNTWIEVRLADFDAPELRTKEGQNAKKVMRQIAMGKQANCVTRLGRRGNTTSYDRVIASCKIEGGNLAALMKRAGVREGGN